MLAGFHSCWFLGRFRSSSREQRSVGKDAEILRSVDRRRSTTRKTQQNLDLTRNQLGCKDTVPDPPVQPRNEIKRRRKNKTQGLNTSGTRHDMQRCGMTRDTTRDMTRATRKHETHGTRHDTQTTHEDLRQSRTGHTNSRRKNTTRDTRRDMTRNTGQA